MIKISKVNIQRDDIDRLVEVIKSGNLVHGNYCNLSFRARRFLWDTKAMSIPPLIGVSDLCPATTSNINQPANGRSREVSRITYDPSDMSELMNDE